MIPVNWIYIVSKSYDICLQYADLPRDIDLWMQGSIFIKLIQESGS